MAKATKAGRPLVACEITAAQLFAARAADRAPGVEVLQARTLGAGVTPNLMNPNISDPAAVQSVVGDALEAIGARGKEISLVIPDAAVRVVLLDFDTLPDRKAEADAVVRFRLKKALPFDVEKASVSYHSQPNGTTLKVIVAVMMNSVLAEYEGVVRQAGFLPGVVLPSTLAALGNLEGDTPSMVVKVAEGSTTIAILDQGRLLLYRTLDHGAGTVAAETLAADIYPSAVFFQDMYGVPIERIYVSGVEVHDAFAARLSQETGTPVEELVSPVFSDLNPGTMPKSALAGVLGALPQ
jgi:type IV pilus assembly protein PilM